MTPVNSKVVIGTSVAVAELVGLGGIVVAVEDGWAVGVAVFAGLWVALGVIVAAGSGVALGAATRAPVSADGAPAWGETGWQAALSSKTRNRIRRSAGMVRSVFRYYPSSAGGAAWP
jgi:hypothetical protein